MQIPTVVFPMILWENLNPESKDTNNICLFPSFSPLSFTFQRETDLLGVAASEWFFQRKWSVALHFHLRRAGSL